MVKELWVFSFCVFVFFSFTFSRQTRRLRPRRLCIRLRSRLLDLFHDTQGALQLGQTNALFVLLPGCD